MAACFPLPPGPPTIDHVSRWLDLASDALYTRSDDDLEELVSQLEQMQLELIRRDARAPVIEPEPEPETHDDLIDEDPEEDEDEDPAPFQSVRRVIHDQSELNCRLALIRQGRW